MIDIFQSTFIYFESEPAIPIPEDNEQSGVSNEHLCVEAIHRDDKDPAVIVYEIIRNRQIKIGIRINQLISVKSDSGPDFVCDQNVIEIIKYRLKGSFFQNYQARLVFIMDHAMDHASTTDHFAKLTLILEKH